MPFKEIRVLVADDMNMMRRLITRHLNSLGIEQIDEAEDGTEAWNKLTASTSSSHPYNLIVCDWNMPGLTGLDILKRARADERLKDVPFLMVTAETESPQVVEAAKAGVTGYVIKPFTQDTLLGKVATILKTAASV